MAIQVGGTTVIDNSRNLSNVGGLKTVGGSSILGSGDIAVGGSTTNNTVGSYAGMWYGGGGGRSYGATSGTSVLTTASVFSNGAVNIAGYGSGISGTWRCMGYVPTNGFTAWVRIS